MIVALDANVLMRDPMCNGLAWRILALGASSWDVAIVVPRVAMIEAVVGYQRKIGYSVEGLDKWAAKYVGQLGLTEVHEAAREGCRAAGERYAQQLQEVLDSLGAAVHEPPEVPLLDLVERAARRQRPCDDNGDGFRDTLNWLTVIDLARQNPSQQVVWISDDSDFAAQDKKVLHEELVAELREAGVADRVRYYSSVHELVTTLVSEHPDQPLDQVRQALRDRTVRDYILDQILPQVVSLPVDPRRCALPVGAPVGRIATVNSPPSDSDWDVEVRGGLDGSAVVSFDVVTEVGILWDAPVMVGDEPSALIIKQLKISGLVTLDDYDRPSAGEITELAALDDDPGAAGWRALDQSNASEAAQRIIANFGRHTVSPEWLKTIAGQQAALNTVSPEWLKTIAGQQAALNTVSPEWLKTIAGQQAALNTVSPEWLKTIQALALLWSKRSRPGADDESGDGGNGDV
jgi:hypothetical protein